MTIKVTLRKSDGTPVTAQVPLEEWKKIFGEPAPKEDTKPTSLTPEENDLYLWGV